VTRDIDDNLDHGFSRSLAAGSGFVVKSFSSLPTNLVPSEGFRERFIATAAVIHTLAYS